MALSVPLSVTIDAEMVKVLRDLVGHLKSETPELHTAEQATYLSVLKLVQAHADAWTAEITKPKGTTSRMHSMERA